MSTFVVTYFGMPFHLMTFTRFLTYLRVSYYIPYIFLITGFILIVKMRILADKPSRGEKKTKEVETLKNGKDEGAKKE